MLMSRLCLKDKSSILVENTLEDIFQQINNNVFIKVKNLNSQREELHHRDNIWCVRQHRETGDN